MPVRFAVQHVDLPFLKDQLSGTIWNGLVALDGDHVLQWQVDEGASLRGLAFVIDWTLTGQGSDIDGRAALRPRKATLGPVNGDLDWRAVRSLMPDLPIGCDITASLNAVEVQIGANDRKGAGNITTTAGECARIGSVDTPTPAPAMIVALGTSQDGAEAVLTTQADRATPLLTARLTGADRVVLTIHRAGAALVPGLPDSADSELDLPLAALLP